jgi:drug/metabolite transporter (DMT)-like permease
MADPGPAILCFPWFRQAWYRLSGNTRGIVWVLAATLSRSAAGTGHKVVAVEVPDAQTLVFVRALVVWSLLLPVVLASRGCAIRTRHVRLHVIRGLLIAASAFCSIYAVTQLTLAGANAYSLSVSLFMLPLGALFLGERAHWLRWVGVTVGFVGVLLMLRPGLAGFQWAAVVALLAAGTDALLGVVLKQASGHDGTVTIAFWRYAANAVVFGTLTGLLLCRS